MNITNSTNSTNSDELKESDKWMITGICFCIVIYLIYSYLKMKKLIKITELNSI